jgi:hypothetical protein
VRADYQKSPKVIENHDHTTCGGPYFGVFQIIGFQKPTPKLGPPPYYGKSQAFTSVKAVILRKNTPFFTQNDGFYAGKSLGFPIVPVSAEQLGSFQQ